MADLGGHWKSYIQKKKKKPCSCQRCRKQGKPLTSFQTLETKYPRLNPLTPRGD